MTNSHSPRDLLCTLAPRCGRANVRAAAGAAVARSRPTVAMLLTFVVACEAIADLLEEALLGAQGVVYVLHPAHGVSNVLRAVLGPPIRHRSLELDLAILHGDGDVARVDLVVVAQAVANVFTNALV